MGMISSPAQRTGQWLTMGELLWIVTGTVKEQHTTIADFNALPESGKMVMMQGSLRKAMTAIEELIALQSGNVPAQPT
jgi:hypothetical protein